MRLGFALGFAEVVGSVVATMSTALPESVMAALAILELDLTGEDITRGTDIGIATILGTPFVLAKLTVIVQGTIHFMFGCLFIPVNLAALARFAAILGLTWGGLTHLVVESPVSFGSFTW
jgi:hypothetical protein